MGPELEFRTDLYRGTAAYYDAYRKPYPAGLFDHLLRRSPAPGTGRLLDLACGTGQIAVPLAGRFSAVVAVDQEPGTVEFGRAKCSRLGVDNISWLVGSAEDVELDGNFDLITVGNAFQRLRRDPAAARMRSLLAPGGAVALLWAGCPWEGERDWQRALFEVFVDWVARIEVADRVPAGFEELMERDPHEAVLRRAGFDYAGKYEFTVEQSWSVGELVGYMYSTSLLNRAALGDTVTEFESDLSARLPAPGPSGVYHESASFAYELAVDPAR